MKTTVQITATAKEFKNGTKGWTVFVEGLEDKNRAEMNFTNPLKAMRYMFLLSKRLSLRINEVELLAISLVYKRNKAEMEAAKNEANAQEQPVAEEPKAEAPAEPAAEEKPKKARKPRTKKQKEEKAE